MAHFRGTIQGTRGEASRLGSKDSGLTVEAQSWQGKVTVQLAHDPATGIDSVIIELSKHHGQGRSMLLYNGPIGTAHVKVRHGQCKVCGHHGDDCTGMDALEISQGRD